MQDLLDHTIAAYHAQCGEPEYRYFKKFVQWTKYRRKPGYHTWPIGDGEEVSREDYEANIEASKQRVHDAFMGRLQFSYWKFDRKMVKDGWRETLIKDVQNAPSPAGEGMRR